MNIRHMTNEQQKAVNREYLVYYREFNKVWGEDNDNFINEEEYLNYCSRYHFYENMSSLKLYQIEHDIMITREQEERCKEWFEEGFDFNFDFKTEYDVTPLDEYSGLCFIDYLITDSEKFKIEVDRYHILCLSNMHKDDQKYVESMHIKDNLLAMKEWLLDYPDCPNEFRAGCFEWIEDGNIFESNPFGVCDDCGYEVNYLEAELFLMDIGEEEKDIKEK